MRWIRCDYIEMRRIWLCEADSGGSGGDRPLDGGNHELVPNNSGRGFYLNEIVR
jgi:hypothetical protein